MSILLEQKKAARRFGRAALQLMSF